VDVDANVNANAGVGVNVGEDERAREELVETESVITGCVAATVIAIEIAAVRC